MRKNWQKEIQKYLQDHEMNIKYSGSGVGQKHIYIADKYKAKCQSSTVHLIVGVSYKDCYHKIVKWVNEQYIPYLKNFRKSEFLNYQI